MAWHGQLGSHEDIGEELSVLGWVWAGGDDYFWEVGEKGFSRSVLAEQVGEQGHFGTGLRFFLELAGVNGFEEGGEDEAFALCAQLAGQLHE